MKSYLRPLLSLYFLQSSSFTIKKQTICKNFQQNLGQKTNSILNAISNLYKESLKKVRLSQNNLSSPHITYCIIGNSIWCSSLCVAYLPIISIAITGTIINDLGLKVIYV